MAETTFEVVKDDYFPADWPDSRHALVTLIDGDLADKVRAHYGKSGQVTVHQWGVEGGYSEYTVEWDWTVWLCIDGVEVWGREEGYSRADWKSEDEVRENAERGHWYGPFDLAQHLLAIKEGRA